MSFVGYVTSLLLIINSCIASQPLCIDSCTFDHHFDANLTLPSNCTFTQRDQCAAILTFDYSARTVKIQFGSYSHKQRRNDIVYTSEIISDTIITLDDESSAQNTVEYYCSTGDRCDYEYVVNQGLPLYIHKTCHHLRVKLISLLHSDPSSTSRSCMIRDGSVSQCAQPCELFSINPNETVRTCDTTRHLEFQTLVGRTTPINKPEYNYRLYSYACTTELCNGYAKQQEIEKVIQSDDGECLVFLENINQTTTSVTTYQSTTPFHNQTTSYSTSFLLFIICVFPIKFFL